MSIILISQLFAQLVFAALISTSAGIVGQEVLTSREVMMNHLVETALYRPTQKEALELSNVKSREFVRETTAVLLESAIFFEADSFSAANISESQIQSQIRKADSALKKNQNWQKLQVTEAELKKVVTRKLRAKDFIKFKIDSATIPITDKEALDYFNGNRLRFENLPFENFKANIKSYLTKQQVDRRLKDWFELLQSKYRVRNYLAENK